MPVRIHVSNRLSPSALLATLATASMLAACGGGASTAPAVPAQANGGAAAQSVARAALSNGARAVQDDDGHGDNHGDGHGDGDRSGLAANPSRLTFTAAQAAAGTPQTVTITAGDDRGEQDVTASIAGNGDCPTLSSTKVTFKETAGDGDHDGDHDGDRDDGRYHGDDHHHGDHGRTLQATITVTPQGAGPSSCTITIARNDDDHGRGHDCGGDLKIPVIVDGPPPPTPTPVPTPTPTPVPTATPSPTPTPSPSPTPCTARQC